MEKYVNDFGKECWRGVEITTPFNPDMFHEKEYCDSDIGHILHTNLGSITVLDRQTGYEDGRRDVETGYRDISGKFWLASCGMDVRYSGVSTVGEAIAWIKQNANTCVGE